MSKNRSHGEGTIYCKSEKSLWAALVSLPNGKRPLKFFKTQREAREWLFTIRKSIPDGIWTETRFHDLRHTTASLFLKANVHPKTVQTILGHSQISVTIYLLTHKNHAPVAQWTEHLTSDQAVVGSSPAGGASICGGERHARKASDGFLAM